MNRHLVVIALAILASVCGRQPPPIQIFHNGRIATVDSQFRTVEAMAILDGRIVSVGTSEEV